MSQQQDEKIFDLYVQNVKRINDVETTRREFEKFVNDKLITSRLDGFFGLVKLVKIPEKSRSHTGSTYQLFLRLSKPSQHEGAACILDDQYFYGLPIRVKVNNIASNDSQWIRSNDAYRNEWVHGEKVKLLKSMTENVNLQNPNQEIGLLKNDLRDRDEKIMVLELELDSQKSKYKQLNTRFERLMREHEDSLKLHGNIIAEQEERILFLKNQKSKPRRCPDVKPTITVSTNNEIERLKQIIEGQKIQYRVLDKLFKSKIKIMDDGKDEDEDDSDVKNKFTN